MKVSYIIVWANTNSLVKMNPTDYPNKNIDVDNALLKHTLFLIDQLLQLQPHEILVMDNEGNFPKQDNPLIRVIPSFQTFDFASEDYQDPYWIHELGLLDYKGMYIPRKGGNKPHIKKLNHAMVCAMAYNHGIVEATGDYLVLQHNDTEYLFDRYSEKEVIHDAINLLERENYEYITVDKKPPKGNSPYGYDYFADCYWFLCRGDFYQKHRIWVDWARGDNNHLATIMCEKKGLKYLHLPGFYETKEHLKKEFFEKYDIKTPGNLHILNDKPFLHHMKGGTGLYNILKRGSVHETD